MHRLPSCDNLEQARTQAVTVVNTGIAVTSICRPGASNQLEDSLPHLKDSPDSVASLAAVRRSLSYFQVCGTFGTASSPCVLLRLTSSSLDRHAL